MSMLSVKEMKIVALIFPRKKICKKCYFFKLTVFWDIAPCSLAEVDRRLKGACCLHHQGNTMDICLIKISFYCKDAMCV
jgi:hypothetical protein